jgi:hypothetical protein
MTKLWFAAFAVVLFSSLSLLAQQTRPATHVSLVVTRPVAMLAPAGSAYSSIVTSWSYTPNAPACPSNGTISNCYNGFNVTITLNGTVVFSQTAGFGTGQIPPGTLTTTWTPTAGVAFGTYTITVTAAGFDVNGNALVSAPASTTLAAGLTTLNPPTGVTAAGK